MFPIMVFLVEPLQLIPDASHNQWAEDPDSLILIGDSAQSGEKIQFQDPAIVIQQDHIKRV